MTKNWQKKTGGEKSSFYIIAKNLNENLMT